MKNLLTPRGKVLTLYRARIPPPQHRILEPRHYGKVQVFPPTPLFPKAMVLYDDPANRPVVLGVLASRPTSIFVPVRSQVLPGSTLMTLGRALVVVLVPTPLAHLLVGRLTYPTPMLGPLPLNVVTRLPKHGAQALPPRP